MQYSVFILVLLNIIYTNILLSILSLSLRILIQGVSRFPGFLSDPWFLLQNTCLLRRYHVLPRFLRAVLRVMHGGGAGVGGVSVCLKGVHSLLNGVTRACSRKNLMTFLHSLTPTRFSEEPIAELYVSFKISSNAPRFHRSSFKKCGFKFERNC